MWLAQYAVCWFVWARDSNSNIETFCIYTTRSIHATVQLALSRTVRFSQILTFSHRFSQIPAQRTLHHISAQVSTLGLHLALANVLLGITTAHWGRYTPYWPCILIYPYTTRLVVFSHRFSQFSHRFSQIPAQRKLHISHSMAAVMPT
jgi:hypothetical protein